jgi:copper transport protein
MTMKILHPSRSYRPLLSRLALGILCIVGLACSTAAPPAAASDDENFFTHLHAEKAMANVTVSPARAGPVDITIQLETTDELPLTAKAVSVTLFNMQSGIGLQTIQAAHTSDDQWHVRISMLASGRWMLGLGISITDTDKISVESPILIK